MLLTGYLTGDVTLDAFAAAGLTAYAAETMASIYASFTESKTTATATIPTD